ncbi:MAG: hypothetical protein U5N58_07115 [Actinomycetota bacterium]|nr:hypothetical protein [Actinomycetota bacterium]
MNSKERVFKAINLQKPDRTPLFAELVPEVEEKFYRKYELKGNSLLTFLGNDIVDCPVGVADSWASIYRDEHELDEWGIGFGTVKHGKGSYAEIIFKPLEKASLDGFKALQDPGS